MYASYGTLVTLGGRTRLSAGNRNKARKGINVQQVMVSRSCRVTMLTISGLEGRWIRGQAWDESESDGVSGGEERERE